MFVAEYFSYLPETAKQQILQYWKKIQGYLNKKWFISIVPLRVSWQGKCNAESSSLFNDDEKGVDDKIEDDRHKMWINKGAYEGLSIYAEVTGPVLGIKTIPFNHFQRKIATLQGWVSAIVESSNDV
jgi:hypothetical protein